MTEKQVFSTKSILLFVFSGLMLALGILFATPLTQNLFDLNFDKLITGLLLLVGGAWYIFKDFKKNEKNLKYLKLAEFILIIVISLYGFILPEFVDSLSSYNIAPNIWLGSLIVFHGIVVLLFETKKETNIKSWKLIGYLLLIAFGGLILDSKSIQVELIIKLVVVGLFLLIAVLSGLKALKLPKVTKQVKEKEIKESEESTNE